MVLMDKIHQYHFFVQQKDIPSYATIKSIKTLVTHDLVKRILRVSGVLTYDVKYCPRCGQTPMLKNRHKLVNIRLSRVSELITIFNLRKQPFICKTCGATVLAETSLEKNNIKSQKMFFTPLI